MARNGLVYFGSYQLETQFVHYKIESYQRRSPIPHKRDRDRVPLCNNGTDLAPVRYTAHVAQKVYFLLNKYSHSYSITWFLYR